MKIYAVLTPAAIALLTQNAVSAPRQLPIQTSGSNAKPIQITETAAPPKNSSSMKRPNPIPKGNPGSWASTNDYPSKALIEQREGTTGFSVQVGPDGKAIACSVTLSSGHSDLDEATCLNISRRGVFDPALDAKGNPTTGKWSSRVRWQIPSLESSVTQTMFAESYPRPPRLLDYAKLRIGKEQYPPTALNEGRQGTARFAVFTDVTGKVQDCSISITSGHADLDQKACEIARGWMFEPARNLNGEPVAGKSTHALHWRLPKTGDAPAIEIIKNLPNPFRNSGTLTLTIDLDAGGKVDDCYVEHSGETAIQSGFVANPQAMCDFWRNRSLQPIVDKNGDAIAVRIVQKVTIEHQAIPPKSQTE